MLVQKAAADVADEATSPRSDTYSSTMTPHSIHTARLRATGFTLRDTFWHGVRNALTEHLIVCLKALPRLASQVEELQSCRCISYDRESLQVLASTWMLMASDLPPRLREQLDRLTAHIDASCLRLSVDPFRESSTGWFAALIDAQVAFAQLKNDSKLMLETLSWMNETLQGRTIRSKPDIVIAMGKLADALQTLGQASQDVFRWTLIRNSFEIDRHLAKCKQNGINWLHVAACVERSTQDTKLGMIWTEERKHLMRVDETCFDTYSDATLTNILEAFATLSWADKELGPDSIGFSHVNKAKFGHVFERLLYRGLLPHIFRSTGEAAAYLGPILACLPNDCVRLYKMPRPMDGQTQCPILDLDRYEIYQFMSLEYKPFPDRPEVIFRMDSDLLNSGTVVLRASRPCMVSLRIPSWCTKLSVTPRLHAKNTRTDEAEDDAVLGSLCIRGRIDLDDKRFLTMPMPLALDDAGNVDSNNLNKISLLIDFHPMIQARYHASSDGELVGFDRGPIPYVCSDRDLHKAEPAFLFDPQSVRTDDERDQSPPHLRVSASRIHALAAEESTRTETKDFRLVPTWRVPASEPNGIFWLPCAPQARASLANMADRQHVDTSHLDLHLDEVLKLNH